MTVSLCVLNIVDLDMLHHTWRCAKVALLAGGGSCASCCGDLAALLPPGIPGEQLRSGRICRCFRIVRYDLLVICLEGKSAGFAVKSSAGRLFGLVGVCGVWCSCAGWAHLVPRSRSGRAAV